MNQIKAIHLLNTILLLGLYDKEGGNETYEAREYRASNKLTITDTGDDILFTYDVDNKIQTVMTPRANIRFIIYHLEAKPEPKKPTKTTQEFPLSMPDLPEQCMTDFINQPNILAEKIMKKKKSK
jgi:hypothetical protein